MNTIYIYDQTICLEQYYSYTMYENRLKIVYTLRHNSILFFTFHRPIAWTQVTILFDRKAYMTKGVPTNYYLKKMHSNSVIIRKTIFENLKYLRKCRFGILAIFWRLKTSKMIVFCKFSLFFEKGHARHHIINFLPNLFCFLDYPLDISASFGRSLVRLFTFYTKDVLWHNFLSPRQHESHFGRFKTWNQFNFISW